MADGAQGAAFLYARRDCQALLEPLVVSWGYGDNPICNSGSRFIDLLQRTGTNDPSVILSVLAAIDFMQQYQWDEVRQCCRDLLCSAIAQVCDLTQLPARHPIDSDLFAQMGIAPLPCDVDLINLKSRLYDDYQVEVSLIDWNGQKFVRISVQGYNSPEDVQALVEALAALLPR
jgi:isopenicillin-N epimerase